MGQLRDRMETDLKLGGYSPSTQNIYLLYARRFAEHFKCSPAQMGEEQIRQFLLYMVQEYRAIMMAQYAGGLRISEACQLRPGDIDSRRMVIHVYDGKGGRDRYTVLSKRLLAYLRDDYRKHRPDRWLFPGGTKAGYASDKAARRVFHAAVAASGISKKITPHVLRHCFATHLLESGVDIAVIQALLGHKSLRATEVYTHVSVEHIGRIKSPLDLLGTVAAEPLG